MRRSSDLLAPIPIRCPALRTVERRWSGAARTFIVWVFAAAVTSGDVDAQSANPRELLLEEIASLTLPTDFAVRGGALAADGTVLLWSAKALWKIAPTRDSTVQICPDVIVAPGLTVFSSVPGRYEFYESTSRQAFRIDPRRDCQTAPVWSTASPESLIGRTSEGWIEIGQRSSTSWTVRAQNRRIGDSTAVISDTTPIRFGKIEDYTSTPATNAVLLTERQFPFRTFRIGPEKAITLALDPAARLAARTRAELLNGWVSLRLVLLDGAFLQIIADPRSDQRRLILLDERGQLIRTSVLDVAMGMLDANREKKVLIAVRNVGHRELVYYRWRWRASD